MIKSHTEVSKEFEQVMFDLPVNDYRVFVVDTFDENGKKLIARGATIQNFMRVARLHDMEVLKEMVEGMKVHVPKCDDSCPFCGRGLFNKCNAYEVQKHYNDAIDNTSHLLSEAITKINE